MKSEILWIASLAFSSAGLYSFSKRSMNASAAAYKQIKMYSIK